MKYLKAQNVLPEKILQIVQEYVDGEFVYIPRKSGKQKGWGERNGTRANLKTRDRLIYGDYLNGADIRQLTCKYFLSEQSIRRVIRQEKVTCSNSLHNHS